MPVYLVTEDGPDHDKFFEARVRVADKEYSAGRGRSKKVAEQIAAEHAYRAIRAVYGSAKAEPDAGAA